MNLNHVQTITRLFTNNLIKEIRELEDVLKQLNINVDKAIPETFKSNNRVKVQVYYSINNKEYFIMFNKSEREQFLFSAVYDNPMPIPLTSLRGYDGELKFINLTLADKQREFILEYSVLISHNDFISRLNNIKEYAVEIVKSTIDSNKYIHQEQKISYLSYLESLKMKMNQLFYDETVPELTIDKFLEKHPVILEQGLNLVNLKHQVVLENTLNIYEHNMKPDLIAFDLMEKNWVIVDYKKARRNIIKNVNKVRTSFKAEVHDLKGQLLDYLEYFEEKEHRDAVNKKYKMDIRYPNAIGIIGNVEEKEKVAFSRLMHNEPKWFKVVPYNYLYDSFVRYVDQYRGYIN